ncbi:hypothetical protein EDD22DRAFT_950103 [Suillus occidentalis]|nr:hypothetical protein EDD22DRAFT_950103 [Suillus occidentalis]
MAPKKWTTPEQEEWLQPWYSNLNEAWLDEFPEPRPSTITAYGPLTEEEKKIMDTMEKSRTNKLYNRFKNIIGNAINVFQTIVESISESKKSMRAYQEHEAYSVLFYKEHAQPQVLEVLKAVKATGERLTSGQHVALIKKETARAYEAETDEVKTQVKEFIEQQKLTREKNKKEGIWSEGEFNYQQNLDKLAAVVNKFLKGLQNATGLSYTLLAGGPSPESGGLIECYSFHVGLTKLGNDFSKAYPEFNAGIMEPFRDYLYHVYPEAAVKRAGQKDSKPIYRKKDHSSTSIYQHHLKKEHSPTHAVSSVNDTLDALGNSLWDSDFMHGPLSMSNLTLPDISNAPPLSSKDTSAGPDYHSSAFLNSDPNLLDANGMHFWMRPDFDPYLHDFGSSSVPTSNGFPQPASAHSASHVSALPYSNTASSALPYNPITSSIASVTALPTLPPSTQSDSTTAPVMRPLPTLPHSTQSDSTLVDTTCALLVLHAPDTTPSTSPDANVTALVVVFDLI